MSPRYEQKHAWCAVWGVQRVRCLSDFTVLTRLQHAGDALTSRKRLDREGSATAARRHGSAMAWERDGMGARWHGSAMAARWHAADFRP